MILLPSTLRLTTALVRTDGVFTAADPWNGGRQSRFTIEVYKLVPAVSGLKVARDTRLLGEDLFGLRSDTDGKAHRIPESLAELWRTRQVAADALPRLLRELQPRLRRSDYIPILHHRRFEWAGAIMSLACVGLLISALLLVPREESAARAVALYGFGSQAIAVPLLFILVARHRRQRRREQMRWLLSRAESP